MKRELYLKGHSLKDIAAAEAHLKNAEAKKHPHIRHLEHSMFWFTLITGVLGSAILSIAMIPVLVAGNLNQGLLVAFIFGVLLGSLIFYISRNMHWLEGHHHLSFAFIIPVIALFLFFFVTFKVNEFNRFAGLSQKNPVLIGVVYFLGFVLPYFIFALKRRLK